MIRTFDLSGMGVVSSLSVAVETLKRNPVLFVAGLIVALVNGVVAGGQMLSTGANALLWTLGSFVVQFASLFSVAGALGMVAEALDGSTRLDTLVYEGKQNFADALAATILLVVVMVAAFVFVGFVAFLAAMGVIMTDVGSGLSPLHVVLAMGVVYLLALLRCSSSSSTSRRSWCPTGVPPTRSSRATGWSAGTSSPRWASTR
jgi:hypothetical protein